MKKCCILFDNLRKLGEEESATMKNYLKLIEELY